MAGYILSISLIIFKSHYAHGTELTPFSLFETGSIRLLHQYKTQQFNSASGLKCLIECHLDANCMAVNYEESTHTCELNDKNVYDVDGYNSEINTEWSVYTKGIPSCDNNWLLNGQSCYFFSADRMAWFDAVVACQNKNATLVQIESENEDIFLVQRLKILHGQTSGDFHYWTNGNDMEMQYQWTWGHPGGQEIGNYKNWLISDPNGDTREDCIALYGYGDFKWADITCDSLLLYICEKLPSI